MCALETSGEAMILSKGSSAAEVSTSYFPNLNNVILALDSTPLLVRRSLNSSEP